MNKSFTLLEILIVTVLIGTLSAFILVGINSITNSANITKSKAFSNSLKNTLITDIIGEWKLNEGTGTNAYDSWKSNNGTLYGTPSWVDINCISAKCIEFDGADDYVRVDDNDSLDTTEDYTIAFWAYNNTGSKTYPTLFNRRGQSATNGFFWCYTENSGGYDDIRYQYSNGVNYASVNFQNILTAYKWTYLAFVFTNSNKTLKLYKNGLYTNDPKTLTNAMPVIEGNLFIGVYSGSTASYTFKGKIEDFIIFNNALPTTLIKQEYYAGINKLFSNRLIEKQEYMAKIKELLANN